MEQMVNSPDIKRVLLICNRDYTEKANNRTGGVGIESLIISNEIYSQAEQTKFIPIIFECDENNKPYLPTFVSSRFFIDLSDDEVFEENYELLMRDLFDRPVSKRPPIGPPPSYIVSDDPVYLPTSHKVAGIRKALIEEKKNAILFVQEYYDAFLRSLDNFLINENDLNQQNCDEVILKSINNMLALRDDFIYFLETYLSHSIEIDVEKLHAFLEKLLGYLLNLEGIGQDSRTFGSIKNDNFRFFFYEMFLYFTTVMIAKERFLELSYILKTSFVVYIERFDKISEYNFADFRNHVYTLNTFRNEKLQLRRVSVTADLVKERSTSKYKFQQLQQSDGILYYISIMNYGAKRFWFPETTFYHVSLFPIMAKAVSKRFFDKVKCIFDVQSKEELIQKVDDVIFKNRDSLDRFYNELPQITYGLNIDNLASIS